MKPLKIIKAGIKYIFNPDYRFLINAGFGFYDNMPDDEYLKRKFKAKMGYELDLQSPKTFNEKLQWLKLYDRKPIYTTMVDKYAARKYVSDIIGEEYLIPLLGVWDTPDEIDFDKLPNQFVLKTTHGCGGMYICRDKNDLNIKTARKILNKTFNKNYFYNVREWPYKNVEPKVIAEKYMQNGNEKNLKVYKVFNFNGTPKIIQTIQNDKQPNESIDYFDTDWNLLDLRQNYPNSEVVPDRPFTLNEILKLSAISSKGFPFLRTDWYEINGKVYFSEFTFYSDAGMERFYPNDWDTQLGNLIVIDRN